jgi:release factor glutamine methyltransferase
MNKLLAHKNLILQLQKIYEAREAEAMARIVFEDVFLISPMKLFSGEEKMFSETEIRKLEEITTRLLNHEPVQYVTGKSIFLGNEFRVNKSVLIPRPETEELVQWVIDSTKNKEQSILDIGTGSGCIAISLKKKFPEAKVFATDISNEALIVACENAKRLNTEIEFAQSDILQLQNPFNQKFDFVISNPPYISRSEAAVMEENVLQFEPHAALFVEGDDELLFYKKIIAFAQLHLNANGKIFFEVNQIHAYAVKKLFMENNFSEVEIRKDLNGNDRMVGASQQ